jgi:hypothetical protein
VIHNAILHLNNEQPLLADLYEVPSGLDVGLRCTNLRMMNGKRPVFIDDIGSVFFFPYLHIRFVEIPPAALAAAGLPVASPVAVGAAVGGPDDGAAPVTNGTSGVGRAVDPESEGDLEIDEDFLRRIREA